MNWLESMFNKNLGVSIEGHVAGGRPRLRDPLFKATMEAALTAARKDAVPTAVAAPQVVGVDWGRDGGTVAVTADVHDDGRLTIRDVLRCEPGQEFSRFQQQLIDDVSRATHVPRQLIVAMPRGHGRSAIADVLQRVRDAMLMGGNAIILNGDIVDTYEPERDRPRIYEAARQLGLRVITSAYMPADTMALVNDKGEVTDVVRVEEPRTDLEPTIAKADIDPGDAPVLGGDRLQ